MAYKSKFYDPEKAHEYYEKHKKLKGRKRKTTKKSISSRKKNEAKAYVRSTIKKEKETKQKQLEQEKQTKLSQFSKEQDVERQATNQKIREMQERIADVIQKRMAEIGTGQISSKLVTNELKQLRSELDKLKGTYRKNKQTRRKTIQSTKRYYSTKKRKISHTYAALTKREMGRIQRKKF